MWQPYVPHCVSELSHWLKSVRNSNKPETHAFIWRFVSINRGDAASTDHTHHTQRSTAQRRNHGTNHHFSNHRFKRAPTSEQQAEEADGGENVQRSYQQQHRAAEVSPGTRDPQPAARIQTGESRYLGDDSFLR